MNKDGFWLIDKPTDWTSFDVCAKMRKILNTRKVGHTGTLDPFATGLLLVATGKATKLIPFLEKDSKKYCTKILLGKTSETLDPESEIQDIWNEKTPGLQEIQTVIDQHFTGKIQQIPPKYSALKIKGQPAYKLAREGKEVEMKVRETQVLACRIVSYAFPILEVELEVAAGFYVRSFARDLGEMLCGGGICQELRRTHIADLSVADAETLETLSTPIDPRYIVTSLDQREIPTGRIQDFIAGRAFPLSGLEGQKVLVTVGQKTLGVGEFFAGNLQPRIVL